MKQLIQQFFARAFSFLKKKKKKKKKIKKKKPNF